MLMADKEAFLRKKDHVFLVDHSHANHFNLSCSVGRISLHIQLVLEKEFIIFYLDLHSMATDSYYYSM